MTQTAAAQEDGAGVLRQFTAPHLVGEGKNDVMVSIAVTDPIELTHVCYLSATLSRLQVIWTYIMDPSVGPYSRIKRKTMDGDKLRDFLATTLVK